MSHTRITATAALACTLWFALSGCGPEEPDALTIAATATTNEPAPSIDAVRKLALVHASGAYLPGDGLVTVVVGDATREVDLTPMRGENVEADERKATEQIDHHLAVLATTLSSSASSATGLDVIGVLDQALEATARGGTVVMMTSGFSTVAPVDLNSAGSWIADPAGFVEVTNRENLPDAAGKHITFVGLGYAAAGSQQQTAGPAARASLDTIWSGLCVKMGAASCKVLPGPSGHEIPTAHAVVPVVELNQIGTSCVGQVTIDATVAFAPDSSVLLPAASTDLKELVASLDDCPATSVINATGHSAEVPEQGGDTSGARPLETARAQAVLQGLIARGLPGRSAGAAGSGGQVVDNMPGGVYDEKLATVNRVVTLTME